MMEAMVKTSELITLSEYPVFAEKNSDEAAIHGPIISLLDIEKL